ncbi:hypothetical protein YUWDRAFT_06942 [Streptomyces sp. AmelKG-D3]|nr:hypothetical protein YUWDRAFT_06942 [Streptomyces sp. AmelKG-D3]
MSLRVRCQGCLGGRPSGSVLGDAPVASVEPGHVHRGALSGPPVRTYPGRPQHNNGSFGSLHRRPAGSRGGNPLRDMGSALTVDPWGDRRRGVSRVQGPAASQAGSGPRHFTGAFRTPSPPPRVHSPTGPRPGSRPGPSQRHRAACALLEAYRVPARKPAARPRNPTTTHPGQHRHPAPPPDTRAPPHHPRNAESPRTPRSVRSAVRGAKAVGRKGQARQGRAETRQCGDAVVRVCGGAGRTRTGRTRNGYGTRLSDPRPGRSREGPHPCRSGAGGRCANPAP